MEQKKRTEFLKLEIHELIAHKKSNRKMDLKAKAATSATQKFRLFKGADSVWKTNCAIRGLALGGWFVPEKFININNFPTPDMPANSNFLQNKTADAHGSIYEGSKAPDMCR